jgi:septal ring factor EnvC (AmiA/AmiB activator)
MAEPYTKFADTLKLDLGALDRRVTEIEDSLESLDRRIEHLTDSLEAIETALITTASTLPSFSETPAPY